LCTEVTEAMTLLNITVHVVDVKCGVTVWRDGFERDIARCYGYFGIFLKKRKYEMADNTNVTIK